MSCKVAFIVNPAADSGRAVRRGDRIRRELAGEPDAAVFYTEYAGHAPEIVRSVIADSRAIVACGGDGTANEIANVLVGSDVSLGVLPAGSANDFIKSVDHGFGGGFSPLAYLRAGEQRSDLGKVTADGGFERCFLNSCGIGFTGMIARQVGRTTWLRGEATYLYALGRVLLGYTPLKMHITLVTPEGPAEMDESVFALSVGNGQVEGGRFRIAPHAAIDDGLLDVCLLRKIPKTVFFRYAMKYLKGTQIFDPRVVYRKVLAVEVELEEPTVMHMDGEVFEGIGGKIRIENAPSAIGILR